MSDELFLVGYLSCNVIINEDIRYAVPKTLTP